MKMVHHPKKSSEIWWCLLFRLVCTFALRSSFVPDEQWQSTEVAHDLVFSASNSNHDLESRWSWEWRAGLRSPLHALLCALPLLLLRIVGADGQWMVWLAPRLLHAVVFSFADAALYSLALRLSAHDAKFARIALMLHIFNWFTAYCAPRTLANTLETSLFLIATTVYPVTSDETIRFSSRHHRYYLTLAAVSVILRPTAALFWIPLVLLHAVRLMRAKGWSSVARFALADCLIVGVVSVGASFALDSWWFGRPTLALLNFARFNVFEGGSALFGVHPWHWYLSQGLWSVAPLHFPLALVGIWIAATKGLPTSAAQDTKKSDERRGETRSRDIVVLLPSSVVYLVVHCALAHKEHRFLLPLLPIFALFAACAVQDVLSRSRRTALALVVIVNTALFIYMARWHQTGPEAVLDAILQHQRRNGDAPAIAALAPCYTLPERSYLHQSVRRVRGLDCSPNWSAPVDQRSRLSESSAFLSAPAEWIRSKIDGGELSEFSHIVLYENTWRLVRHLLESHGWQLCARVFHAHFLHDDHSDHHLLAVCAPTRPTTVH